MGVHKRSPSGGVKHTGGRHPTAGDASDLPSNLGMSAEVEAEAKVCRHVDGPGWTCSY